MDEAELTRTRAARRSELLRLTQPTWIGIAFRNRRAHACGRVWLRSVLPRSPPRRPRLRLPVPDLCSRALSPAQRSSAVLLRSSAQWSSSVRSLRRARTSRSAPAHTTSVVSRLPQLLQLRPSQPSCRQRRQIHNPPRSAPPICTHGRRQAEHRASACTSPFGSSKARMRLLRRGGRRLAAWGFRCRSGCRQQKHAALYPTGVLSQEREGVRAIALCSAGSMSQRQAAARRFLAQASRVTALVTHSHSLLDPTESADFSALLQSTDVSDALSYNAWMAHGVSA